MENPSNILSPVHLLLPASVAKEEVFGISLTYATSFTVLSSNTLGLALVANVNPVLLSPNTIWAPLLSLETTVLIVPVEVSL